VRAAADDQQRLDAAMDAFDDRMTAAGWESQGPPPEDDDDAFGAGDEVVAECLDELAELFEDLNDNEFPGQVAMSTSDEFSFVPADAPATTAEFSLDVSGETTSAVSATVDDANVASVTQYIDVLGSKETGDCLRQAMEASMEAESEDSDIPFEFEFNVSTEGNLGIGDHSAALSYELSAVFIVPISFAAEAVFAQSGNDFAAVVHVVEGEPQSGFDPRAELQTIVDSLND
jgi:hypothetical protein